MYTLPHKSSYLLEGKYKSPTTFTDGLKNYEYKNSKLYYAGTTTEISYNSNEQKVLLRKYSCPEGYRALPKGYFIKVDSTHRINEGKFNFDLNLNPYISETRNVELNNPDNGLKNTSHFNIGVSNNNGEIIPNFYDVSYVSLIVCIPIINDNPKKVE